MPLYPYHNPHDPAAQRANRWLRQIDPSAFAVWNGALKCHEVWTSNAGGSCLFRLESDQGRPVPLDSFRGYVAEQFHQMRQDPEEQLQGVLAHNERLARQAWQAQVAAMAEDAAYLRDAVRLDTASRYDPNDVMQSLERAHGPVHL